MLKTGQVLSLKIRFNNTGDVSQTRHPYLVIYISTGESYVEIAQMDSLAGKEYKAAKPCNCVVYCDEPYEQVIDKDSYVQLDNEFRLELSPELEQYRRQEDCLSRDKLETVLMRYSQYRESNVIDPKKKVYISLEELTELNS